MTVHPEPTGLADPAGLDTERVHRIYRHPHANPELSMREHATADFIEAELDDLGISHFRCGGTGVVGVVHNGEGVRVPWYRNDLDEAVRIETALRAEPGEDNVSEGAPNMGSEDFGHLADAIGVPSVYWMFGGFDPADGEPPSNHSPYFAPAMEPTLTTGARAAITGILTYLGSGADRSGD